MKVPAAIAMLLVVAGCTNGGIMAPGGGGAALSIDVNLTLNATSQTPAGSVGGYAPAITNVAVGTTIRFINSDGFAHTATLVPNATTFPSGSPFAASAQTQSGTALSTGWSTGTLAAGARSQTLSVDRPGTYLYGCFFHYGAPMRAEIVAQ